MKMLGGPEVLVYNTPPGMKWPPPGILETDPEAFSSVFNPGVSGAFFWAQQVCWLAQSPATKFCDA